MPVFAGAIVGLSAGQSRPARLAAHVVPLAAARDAAASLSRPAFRLGTAGGPLGWSTAVGDFNTDGTPDVAIADRVLRPVNGASYQIEFSVSGREPKTVAFDSAQAALTVGVFDVDHDNDLDVVVSAALSREVVGVWLNDGEGGFTSSDARPFASEIAETHSVDTAAPSKNTSVASLTSRGDTGHPRVVTWTPAAHRPSPVIIRPVRFHAALLSSAASSRAPPHTLHAIS